MLEVRVQAKARRERVEVLSGPRLKVYVTTAPEGGKANRAVIACLADRLGIANGDITIVRGHRGRDKVIRVAGLDDSEAFARLAGQSHKHALDDGD